MNDKKSYVFCINISNLVNTRPFFSLQLVGPMEPEKNAQFGSHQANKALFFTIILQLSESLQKAPSRELSYGSTEYVNMPICQYASMPVCQYASMSVCQYVSIPVCQYASMSIC